MRGLRGAPPPRLELLLVTACAAGARRPVLRLLEAAAAPDSAARGRSALCVAAERGDAALVALLVRRGATDAGGSKGGDGGKSGKSSEGGEGGGEGGSAMQAAVRGGHTAAVRALLGARHAGPEAVQALLLAAASGRTGTLLAAVTLSTEAAAPRVQACSPACLQAAGPCPPNVTRARPHV